MKKGESIPSRGGKEHLGVLNDALLAWEVLEDFQQPRLYLVESRGSVGVIANVTQSLKWSYRKAANDITPRSVWEFIP